MAKHNSPLILGSVSLDQPRVVVSVGYGVERNEIQAALAQGADIVELRLDLFPQKHIHELLEELKWYEGMPLLATIRSAAEGGQWNGTEAQRLALFNAVMPYVHALDIEIGSKTIVKDVIRLARIHKRLVIGSFHDFSKTPTERTLTAKAKLAASQGVDILKIATYCNDWGDLQRLARFTLDQKKPAPAIIGMGPHGAATRIFFPALGSRLTYAFVGAPTAPGQLTCSATLEYLSAFYPERRA